MFLNDQKFSDRVPNEIYVVTTCEGPPKKIQILNTLLSIDSKVTILAPFDCGDYDCDCDCFCDCDCDCDTKVPLVLLEPLGGLGHHGHPQPHKTISCFQGDGDDDEQNIHM